MQRKPSDWFFHGGFPPPPHVEFDRPDGAIVHRQVGHGISKKNGAEGWEKAG